MGQLQLADDLAQQWLRFAEIASDGNAMSQAPACQVKHIIDELGHSATAILHQSYQTILVRAIWLQFQKAEAVHDRAQRISEVMAQHGNKLLAQLRYFLLRRESL